MFGITICFVAIDLYVQYGRYTPGMYHHIRLDDLFHLGKEANIPTWYNAALLGITSLLLFVIARAEKFTVDRHSWGWLLLGILFLYLSIDEIALLHERVAMYLGSKLPGNPLMTFGWIIPGILITGTLGVSYVPFVVRLPSRTRWLTILAGVIYLAGALVTEFAAIPYEMGRPPDMGFAILVATEECLEMCGIILFLYALLDYMRSQIPDLRITFTYK